jgi:protein gp37
MGKNSGIEWTDHTFNPWIGCSKVSPACDHCYAESYANRYGKAVWGQGQPRQLTSDGNWKQPLKWNHEAMITGTRRRVFCASLADVFDNEVPEEWRVRLWQLVYATPHLDWLLLTKRIGNARHMLPLGAFHDGPLPNLWLGISVVNQEEADRDIPKLLALPAKVRFLSMEPLLGPVTLAPKDKTVERLSQWYGPDGFDPTGSQSIRERATWLFPKIDWVIVGGESGKEARPMHPDWARSLRDQCLSAHVPFFFKQWGEWGPAFSSNNHGPLPYRDGMVRFGKKQAGRMLDGLEWNDLPSPETGAGIAA